MKKNNLFVTSLALLATLFFMLPACAYDKLVIFGDSLSDSGVQNNNPDVIGKEPTWTSPGGHVWSYYLAQHLGLAAPQPNNSDFEQSIAVPNNYVIKNLTTGTNYAAGGATTGATGYEATDNYSPPSMLTQVSAYTQNGTPGTADPAAIYFIWGGSNDIFETVINDLADGRILEIQADLIAAEQQAVTNIETMITQLKAAGATKIVVINVPNLGLTALFNPTSPIYAQAGFPQYATQISEALALISYNFSIDMNNILSGQGLIGIDTWTLVSQIITSGPGTFTDALGINHTISNVNDSACPDVVDDRAISCTPATGTENYVFEDGVHPTDIGHQIIAAQICSTLNANGIPCS